MKATFLGYLKFINYHIKKYRILLFFSILTSIIISSVSLINPLASQYLLDNILLGKSENQIYFISIFIIVAFLIVAIFDVLNSFVTSLFKNKIDYKIKLHFFQHLQKSLFVFNISKFSGEIYYRMFKDGSFLIDYFCRLTIDLSVNVILILAVSAFMFYWSAPLAILTIFMVVFQIIIVCYFRKPLLKIVDDQRNIEQDLSANINQIFNDIETTRLLGLEDQIYLKVKNKFEKVIKISVKNTFISSVLQQISGFCNQIWAAMLLIIGSIMVVNSDISIGSLIGFYMLIGSFYKPLLSIVTLFINYPELKISYRRFLEYYQNIDPSYESNLAFEFKKDLTIEDLSFSYDNKNYVIQKLNQTYNMGDIIAITGKSGCGKTTFINLLARLLYPSKGQIKVDNNDIAEINIIDYRKQVGILPQSSILLNNTLRYNISLGNPEILDSQIVSILQQMGLHNYIDKLDSPLGTKGMKLSIGETQRIALARVLIKNPKILILDEPTSSVDKTTEQSIIELLKYIRSKNDMLVIICTHSKEIIEIANRVIDLEDILKQKVICK